MHLVVGLGNPGDQYHFTRHNFGFLVLDFYLKTHGLNWEPQPKFQATWLKTTINLSSSSHHQSLSTTADVIFIKPQEFYNLSGRAVKNFAHYFKIPSTHTLVLCDDFSLDFGTLRFRIDGQAGGNNGLKSLISELQTSAFPRLRLGTENSALRTKIGDSDFVLSRFTTSEKSALPQILTTACRRLDDWLIQSITESND